jgi:DNA recombination protein RmuC
MEWLAGMGETGWMLLLGGLSLALLIVLAWMQIRDARNGAGLQARIQALETLLERQEQSRPEREARLREAMLAHMGQTQQSIERRLGELQQAAAADAARLRETLLERFNAQQAGITGSLNDSRTAQQRALGELREEVRQALGEHGRSFEKRQTEALKTLLDSLRDTMGDMRRQITDTLGRNTEELGKRVEALTERTDGRLKEISGQVEKRLDEGFEKTTQTFINVLKHLERIDEAQKKITELSGNVVSLQEVLTDKRTRGAFGEVQLNTLVRNVMPENSFELQKELSNGKRVDCILYLPKPTGSVCIDAKFPLENYQRMMDNDLAGNERRAAETQFKRDVKKHIRDIADKYIIPGETADGAVLFIPAEAVFAEIHAHHPDVVQEAQQRHVWLVSPTTLMAILTTASAVLKDEATRQQVHIIQRHLHGLSEDFGRFQQRMDKLAQHIDQAQRDVKDVHTSAKKITRHFQKIEQVELDEAEDLVVLEGKTQGGKEE